MKIVLGSNSPFTNSGYGTQSYFMCKTLMEAGHEVVFLAWNMSTGNSSKRFEKISYNEIKEISLKSPFYEKNAVEEKEDISSKMDYYLCLYENWPCQIRIDDVNKILKKEKADLYIYLLDIWITEPNKKFCCPSMTWLPLHFTPLEDSTKAIIPTFDKIMYMSTFGREVVNNEMPEINPMKDPVIPHYIDYDFLKSKSDKYDREYFRNEIGVTKIEQETGKKVFLISVVARNSEESNRKYLDMSLLAFKDIVMKYPEINAYLYVHTQFVAKVNLLKCMAFYKVPKDRLFVPDQMLMMKSGFTTDYMNGIYYGSDVLMANTGSEGFGLPILEAQLLGCPVVTTRCTAMLDYLYNGEYIDVLDDKFVYANTSYWYLPDPLDVSAKIKKVYDRTPEENEELKQYAIEKIKKDFSYETVGKQFLEEVEKFNKIEE